jgi:hypothetical protein
MQIREALIKSDVTSSIPSGTKAHADLIVFTAVRAEAMTCQSCPDAKRQRVDLLINTPEQD